MQIDALAVRLRPRTAMEATDLGVRLCQSAARSVFPCFALVALPVMGLAIAAGQIAVWLPIPVIWFAKPWLDRTIVFVLSRAAFGQATTPGNVWRAQRDVWWSQLLFTWTIRRLSLWRSLTQPVYQLEGLSILKSGSRVRAIRRRNTGGALVMTSVFSLAEMALTTAVVSLVFWLAPSGQESAAVQLFFGDNAFSWVCFAVAYAIAVLFLEPFYVAAGFAMYLTRRADLEAWDIEQEFRRAFAPAAAVVVAILLLAPLAPLNAASTDASQPGEAEITRALDIVKADPNLAALRTIKMLRWKGADAPKPSKVPEWLKWIVGLFRWFDQSARVLVWGVVAVLAVLLIGYVAHFVGRRHGVTSPETMSVAPSRVFDLDIRPESLPDDVGAAARLLWDRSEHRAALALLYRAMLSRLAHVHQVPIRDSSTEGDCLDLASQRLSPARSEYASCLIGAWQRAVYGSEDIRSDIVYRLCDGFSSALDQASPVGIGPGTTV